MTRFLDRKTLKAVIICSFPELSLLSSHNVIRSQQWKNTAMKFHLQVIRNKLQTWPQDICSSSTIFRVHCDEISRQTSFLKPWITALTLKLNSIKLSSNQTSEINENRQTNLTRKTAKEDFQTFTATRRSSCSTVTYSESTKSTTLNFLPPSFN